MFQRRFILGSVNQGHLEVGEKFSAYEHNTIFLSSVCTAEDFLDEPMRNPDSRSYLKSLGSLLLKISSIDCIDEKSKIAELEMEGDSQERYEKLTERLFRKNIIGYFHPKEITMTMSVKTGLEVGDCLNVGYISVIEPLGGGDYILRHDYPIERTQGPRFEKI